MEGLRINEKSRRGWGGCLLRVCGVKLEFQVLKCTNHHVRSPNKLVHRLESESIIFFSPSTGNQPKKITAEVCFSVTDASPGLFFSLKISQVDLFWAHCAFMVQGQRSLHKLSITYFLFRGLRHVNGLRVSSIQRISDGSAASCYTTSLLHDH